jgi:hypothetical protein
LALVATLSACATRQEPSFPAVAGVEQIDLEWRPRAGMRIVQRVTTDVDASGMLTGPLAEGDKKQHTVLTRSLDITDVGQTYVDLRFGQDGFVVPATLRVSRAAVAESVKADDPSASDGDKKKLDVAMRQLVQPLTQSAQLLGRWRVGETRPFEIHLAGLPDTSGSGEGTATLRRVVTMEGRRAAEFEWTGNTEFLFTGEPGRGVPGRMALEGREWRDLETGATLRSTATARAEFTRQGRPTRVEYRTVEIIDLAQSRL